MLKQDRGGVNVVVRGPITESVQVKLSVVRVFFAIVGLLGGVKAETSFYRLYPAMVAFFGLPGIPDGGRRWRILTNSE